MWIAPLYRKTAIDCGRRNLLTGLASLLLILKSPLSWTVVHLCLENIKSTVIDTASVKTHRIAQPVHRGLCNHARDTERRRFANSLSNSSGILGPNSNRNPRSIALPSWPFEQPVCIDRLITDASVCMDQLFDQFQARCSLLLIWIALRTMSSGLPLKPRNEDGQKVKRVVS